MINTPPSERPQPAQQQPQQQSLSSTGAFIFLAQFPRPPSQIQSCANSDIATAHIHERNHYASSSGPGTPRNIEEYTSAPPIANAAAALAQLHTHKVEPDWDSDMVPPSLLPTNPPSTGNYLHPTRNGTPTPNSTTPATCSPPSSSPPSGASTTRPQAPTLPYPAHTTGSQHSSPTPPQTGRQLSHPSGHHRGTRDHANSRCRDMRGSRRIRDIRAVMGWDWGI